MEKNENKIFNTNKLAKENSLKIHHLVENVRDNFIKLNKYLNMENPDLLEIYAFLIHTNHVITQMNFLLDTIKDIYFKSTQNTLSILAISKQKFLSLTKKYTNKETHNFIEKISSEIFEIDWESNFFIQNKKLTLSFLIPRLHKHSLCHSNDTKIAHCKRLSVLLTTKPKLRNTKKRIQFYQQRSCFYDTKIYQNCINIKSSDTFIISKTDHNTSFCHLEKGHSKHIIQLDKSVKMKIHADTAVSCPGLRIHKTSNLFINAENIIEISNLNNSFTNKIHKHVKIHLSPPDESIKNHVPFNWEDTLRHNYPLVTIMTVASIIFLLYKLKSRKSDKYQTPQTQKTKDHVINEGPEGVNHSVTENDDRIL